MRFIAILLALFLALLAQALAFGGEDDGTSGRRSIGLKARKCRGVEIKPTRTRAAVDRKCHKKFPSSPRCTRLCRLENLRVIVSIALYFCKIQCHVQSAFQCFKFLMKFANSIAIAASRQGI